MSNKDDFQSQLIKSLKLTVTEGSKKRKAIDDFSIYGLKFNPFPIAAIAQHTHLEPLNKKLKDQIQTFISSTYQKGHDEERGDYAGLTVVGEYGYGKTHLMKYIEELIDSLNESSEVDFKALTTFIDRPTDSPRKIIHKIVEELEPDTLRRLIWSIIMDEVLGENPEEFVDKFVSSLFGSIASKELFEIPVKTNPIAFYDKFKKFGGKVSLLREECKNVINNEIVNDNMLAERYLNLIFPEKNADTNWDVLSGYISARDIQNKEVKFLNSVVGILRKNGYNMLYVFVDEFEDLSKLKGAKLTDYISTLNTMINNQRKWSIIVSLTQSALDIIKEESPPLYDRLVTIELRLSPLTPDQARQLVINYLNLARDKSTDITPFSQDLIQSMHSESEGNYRSFIRSCSKVIEYGHRHNYKAPLPADIIHNAI